MFLCGFAEKLNIFSFITQNFEMYEFCTPRSSIWAVVTQDCWPTSIHVMYNQILENRPEILVVKNKALILLILQ